MQKDLILDLKKKAISIRKDILGMVAGAGKGHLATAFSETDILTALYFHFLKIDPGNPQWENRDRFILSKGHGCETLYVLLANLGYFEKDLLKTYLKFKTRLAGHPNMHKLPGVEATTGSLGHGFSISVGVAMNGKMEKANYRIFTMLGDGEINEGQVWEAAMCAAHYKLDNLIGIIDRNNLQNDGCTTDVMNSEPLGEKWESFGWSVREIDGHDMKQIVAVFDQVPFTKGKPSMVIARTTKGKCAPSIENRYDKHYIHISEEDANVIMKDLCKIEEALPGE
jgi:transketolase